MNEFEKRKREVLGPLYFEAGAALFDCQKFENDIAYLLFLLANIGIKGLKVESTVSIMENESKKTAGQLINMLKKHLEVSDELEKELARGLEARNEIVHRIFTNNIEKILEPDEHRDIIKDIRSLRVQIMDASNKIKPPIACLMKIYGMDIDKMNKDIEEQFMKKNIK